jgi:hypothetical protein
MYVLYMLGGGVPCVCSVREVVGKVSEMPRWEIIGGSICVLSMY